MKGIKMNIENLEKIFNENYSVKQMISYFIITYENTEDKLNFNDLMHNLIINLIKTDKKDVFNIIDTNNIHDIDLYWKLTTKQLISYGYIIFSDFIMCNQRREAIEIIKDFNTIYKLYSPSNAEEFVKNKINKQEANLYIKVLNA